MNEQAEHIVDDQAGMRLFATLVHELGTHTKTNDKLDALVKYFTSASDKDKVWMIALFSGRRPRRTISPARLSEWCSELVGLPLWLFGESYHTVGDLSDTIALLIPDDPEILKDATGRSLSWYVEKFLALEKSDEEEKKRFIISCWKELNNKEKFVLNKLFSITFRFDV